MAVSLPDLQEADEVTLSCPPDINNKELWLISIPNEIQIKSLNGKKLVINSDDSNTIDINSDSYSVNITKEQTKIIPIVTGRKADKLSFGNRCKGEVILNKCPQLEDNDGELVPLKKRHCREEIDLFELKQRWKPFGYKTPKVISKKHKHKRKKTITKI